jgi:carboxylesterase
MPQLIANFMGNWWPGLLILVIVLVIVVVLFRPRNIDGLTSHPNPVKSYAEAVQRIDVLQAREKNLNPLCQAKLLTHGDKTDRVIVFVHGYTTCPQQFAELGERFYDLGYNVLMLPVPHHGLADRMTDELGLITSEELAVYADQVVDLAPGLGKYVVMAGISMGGVIASWAAQNRSEIDFAVIMSPGFSFKPIPTSLTVPIANIVVMLPVWYVWWDTTLKEKAGPPYAYPRFTYHGLGEIMRLGFAVRAAAQRTAPAARSILVVTNANDTSVDNEVTAQMVQLWRDDHTTLATYKFEKSLGLPHDMIDPNQKGGKTDVVYPRLIDLINKSFLA